MKTINNPNKSSVIRQPNPLQCKINLIDDDTRTQSQHLITQGKSCTYFGTILFSTYGTVLEYTPLPPVFKIFSKPYERFKVHSIYTPP